MSYIVEERRLRSTDSLVPEKVRMFVIQPACTWTVEGALEYKLAFRDLHPHRGAMLQQL